MARRRLNRREKQLIYLVLLLILSALGVARSGLFSSKTPKRSRTDPVVFQPGASAAVINVIDGDTFDARVSLRGRRDAVERVRLLRINTPEIDQHGYAEATRALESMIAGRSVILESDEPGGFERDQYGRLLAYARSGGVLVNVEMVRSGWTKYYKRFGAGVHETEFARAEEEARSSSRGLWRK